eukprot:scpid56544/ scgid27717/ 
MRYRCTISRPQLPVLLLMKFLVVHFLACDGSSALLRSQSVAVSNSGAMATENVHYAKEVKSLGRTDVTAKDFVRCNERPAAPESMSLDVCPVGFSTNVTTTQCCLLKVAVLQQLQEITRPTNCCADGQCPLSVSSVVSHSYICLDDSHNNTSHKAEGQRLDNITRLLQCCSSVCCIGSRDSEDSLDAKTRGKRWIVILSLAVSGSALIVIVSALYICWRQAAHEKHSIKFSPMKRRYQAIRMSPPALQVTDRDVIDTSELIFPAPSAKPGPAAKPAPTKIASVRAYGKQNLLPSLDSSVLHLTSQEVDGKFETGTEEVEIDVPFVSRTRVQPVSSMQTIIPR